MPTATSVRPRAGACQDGIPGYAAIDVQVLDRAPLPEAHLISRPDDPNALVFTSPEGSTLNHKNFYRRHFKPAVLAAELPAEMRFHDLRHTCAALCIALGAHPKAIQERLGHSSSTVTLDRYEHLFPKLDETLTSRLDGLHHAAASGR